MEMHHSVWWYRIQKQSGQDVSRFLNPEAPLHLALDWLYEGPEYSPQGSYKNSVWNRALAYWLDFNILLLDESKAHELLPYLSFEQYHSLRILREWWRAQYQRSSASLAYILELTGKCDEITHEATDSSGDNLLHKALMSLQLIRWPEGDIQCYESNSIDARTVLNYNKTMQNLFKLEFCWMGREASEDPYTRMTRGVMRHEAMQWAWCQQAAMAVFESALASSSSAWRDLCLKYSTQKAMDPSVSNLMPITPIAHGPQIEACGWLNKSKIPEKIFLPWYLWDRHTHQTIETAELDDFVDYTAISHTWGRWTLKGRWRQKTKFVKVAGVPWKVPRNERFDVLKLGERLDGLACQTRYVWIDLFCIPQNGGPIMREEIARQADIFRNAKYAVAWLNDVDSFDCLNAALKFMLLTLIDFAPSSREQEFKDKLLDDEWNMLAHNSIGLLAPIEGNFKFAQVSVRPNVWFTSLWTLQEVCLRPDMWLSTSHWQMAAISQSQPITIMGMVVIWNTFFHKTHPGDRPSTGSEGWNARWDFTNHSSELMRSHPALVEFYAWARTSGFMHLTDLTPSYLLALGDTRNCTSRRAEAIMSAIGATKWYSDMPEQLHEQSLVLGKYPMAFIRELQSKDPINFFASIAKFDNAAAHPAGFNERIGLDPANRRIKTGPLEFRNIVGKPRGSMLPFSEHGANFAGLLPAAFNNFDCHDSVKDWIIRADGRVLIESACIVASSSVPLTNDRSIIHAQLGEFDSDVVPNVDGELHGLAKESKNIDLEAWVHSRSFEVHAVAVGHRLYTHHYKSGKKHVTHAMYVGVIIARWNDELYVRLGTWNGHVKNQPMPAATTLNWVVA
jgi:hypothetical protein